MKHTEIQMIGKVPLVVLIAGIVVTCFGKSESMSAQGDPRDAGEHNRDAVLKSLRRIASSSELAIRLYYRGACSPNAKDDPIPFPFTKVQPPSKGKTGVTAVREIFKNDKNVAVTEDAGIIRIWIGKVSTEILRTKLSLLTLDPMGRYNPGQAIIVINNTKEMQIAMRSLGLTPVWSASSSRTLPGKDLPHLPASIKDVTVEQFLDLMAKTWDGPVIYGACVVPTDASGKRRFIIDSAQDVIPKGAWKKLGIERPD